MQGEEIGGEGRKDAKGGDIEGEGRKDAKGGDRRRRKEGCKVRR